YSKLTGTVPTWNQNTTGNAATATALKNARTINGVSFDGTANINIGALFATNGLSALVADAASGSVNRVKVEASTTGNAVNITAEGSDADVSMCVAPKGAGNLTLEANLVDVKSGASGFRIWDNNKSHYYS